MNHCIVLIELTEMYISSLKKLKSSNYFQRDREMNLVICIFWYIEISIYLTDEIVLFKWTDLSEFDSVRNWFWKPVSG